MECEKKLYTEAMVKKTDAAAYACKNEHLELPDAPYVVEENRLPNVHVHVPWDSSRVLF